MTADQKAATIRYLEAWHASALKGYSTGIQAKRMGAEQWADGTIGYYRTVMGYLVKIISHLDPSHTLAN